MEKTIRISHSRITNKWQRLGDQILGKSSKGQEYGLDKPLPLVVGKLGQGSLVMYFHETEHLTWLPANEGCLKMRAVS